MIINFPLYIVLTLLLISFVFVKFYILCIVGPHQHFGCQIPYTTYWSNKVYLLTYLLNCRQKILLWLRYVDDTSTAVHKDEIDDNLDEQNADIQFNEEIGEKGNFLFQTVW